MPSSKFGISLPRELAELLDGICSAFGISRSELIRSAVSEHIHEYAHVLRSHPCLGVVVAYGSRCVEDWGGLAKAYACAEARGMRISVAVVEGVNEAVAELVNRLVRSGFETRYVPIL